MAQPSAIAKRLFSSGELDPALRTRPDTENWQSGLATFRNMTGKKSSGGRNRPGTKYVCPVSNNGGSQRLLEFDYADGLNDSFALLFESTTIHPIKNQRPVLLPPMAITAITKDDPGIFTCPSHGFSTNDIIFIENETGMVELNGNFWKVIPIDANNFSIQDNAGRILDTTNLSTFAGGATASRSYSIVSPFSNQDLFYLNYDQSFDQVKIASGTKPLKDLNHISDSEWVIEDSKFSPSILAPTSLAVSVGGTTSTYAITAIKSGTGEESLAAEIIGATGTSGTPQTLTWTSSADAFCYNVYRADSDGIFGLIGQAAEQASPTFKDDNVPSPNFNIQPPGVQGTLFSFGFDLSMLDQSSVFPKTALPGNGTCIAWNDSQDMVAIGCNATPFLLIYKYQSGIFTLLSNPLDFIPTGRVNALAWSPDGSYLAVALSPTPGNTPAILFKRNGQNFVTNITGYTQPTGNAFGCCWMPDSSFVCFTHATTPFMTCLERSGDTFTKIPNPVSFPGGPTIPLAQVNCCVCMAVPYHLSDGQNVRSLLIVGCNYDGGSKISVMVYAVFTKSWATAQSLASWLFNVTPGVGGTNINQQTSNVLSCSYASAQYGNYILLLGTAGSDYVKNYVYYPKSTGSGIFTLQPAPAVPPDGSVNSIAQTPNGFYAVLATSGTKKLILYELIGNILVLSSDQPKPDMAGNSNGVSFSPDSLFLAVVESSVTPFAAMYSISTIHPACVGFAQQRLRIGNTTDHPATEYDSAVNAYTNFAIRVVPTGGQAPATDPIQFLTWSRKYNAIKHLLCLKKLIQLTTNGCIVLEGDGNGNISPDTVNPRLVGYQGANHIRPAFVGDTIIFVGATGNTLWDLKKESTASGYFSSDNFSTLDLTIPSQHLFRGKNITWLCYQEKPDSIIWGGFDDGTYFSLTYVKDQGIFTFGRHDMGTIGKVLDGCCVRESNGTDRVYLVADIGSEIEPNEIIVSMQDRDETMLEDQFFVDCGVKYDGRNKGDITLSFHGTTNILTSSLPIFSASSVGKQIRVKYDPNPTSGFTDFLIKTFTDSSTVVVEVLRTVGTMALNFMGYKKWSWLTDTVDGLWHLEQREVAILADGEVISSPNNPYLRNANGDTVVSTQVNNGKITFSIGFKAEVVIVGLPITSDIETLEIDTPSGPSLVELKKNVCRVNVNVKNTKGLFFGSKAPELHTGQILNDSAEGLFLGYYGNNQQAQDLVGAIPMPLLTERIVSPIDGDWNDYGKSFIRQVDPLPVEINGMYPVLAV